MSATGLWLGTRAASAARERALSGLAQPGEGAGRLRALGRGERRGGAEDAAELGGGALAGAAQGAHGEEAGVAGAGEARGGHLADAIDDGERDVLEPADREQRLRHGRRGGAAGGDVEQRGQRLLAELLRGRGQIAERERGRHRLLARPGEPGDQRGLGLLGAAATHRAGDGGARLDQGERRSGGSDERESARATSAEVLSFSCPLQEKPSP